MGTGPALRGGPVGSPGPGHLGRCLAQLRAQSRVLERLAGLLLAQAETGEERHGVHSRHGWDTGNRKKTLGPLCTLTLAH